MNFYLARDYSYLKKWRSYQSKASLENKNSSIAKDEVALLAERLEFFVPKLLEMLKLWQWLLYLSFWSLFVTVIDRHDMHTWSAFLIAYVGRTIQYFLTVLPILYLVDYLRPVFKNVNPIKVSLYILVLIIVTSIVSLCLVMLVKINGGWLQYNPKLFIVEIVFNTLLTTGFSIVYLLYFVQRQRELMALKQSFEHKFTAQNDILKARLAPHFFFNTINTLTSLIESNPTRASELLQHVSALFRASFSGTREISFEEEVALCEHYLAIESSRLADKLVVNWNLPDDDTMYDMTIASLTLQSVLEKMLLNVVEMSTETVCIDIVATWKHHRVVIVVTVQLPRKSLMIIHELRRHIDFYIQAERLRSYFGDSADIMSTVTSEQIVTTINYYLHDVSI